MISVDAVGSPYNIHKTPSESTNEQTNEENVFTCKTKLKNRNTNTITMTTCNANSSIDEIYFILLLIEADSTCSIRVKMTYVPCNRKFHNRATPVVFTPLSLPTKSTHHIEARCYQDGYQNF